MVKSNKKDKVEYFSDKIRAVRENEKKVDLKKLNSFKKKALRSILGHHNIFNLKFLVAWSKTNNFKNWLINHDKKIS